jgi:hypothetical protein
MKIKIKKQEANGQMVQVKEAKVEMQGIPTRI